MRRAQESDPAGVQDIRGVPWRRFVTGLRIGTPRLEESVVKLELEPKLSIFRSFRDLSIETEQPTRAEVE